LATSIGVLNRVFHIINGSFVMTWDEVKELAPLHVIGALDGETARDLEASLDAATPEQLRVVARWRDVATLLPQALPLQTPQDHVKERLFNRIAEEAQKTPIEIAVEESALKEADRRGEKKILPFVQVQPRQAESRTLRWLLIAATALLAFTSAYLFTRNAKLARERDNLSRERDKLSEELDGVRGQLDNIVSSGTRVIAMVGEEAPQANAKVFWDTKARQWAIYIYDLPTPPSDKDYQLWYVTANSKISAAVFRTRAGADRLETDAASGCVGRPGRHRGDPRTQRRLASTYWQVLPQSQHLA
jgi:anti-sigma-K factor RskA